MRVVVDTNVLISGMFWHGAAYRCLLAAEGNVYDLVLSEPILDELRGKLTEKFSNTTEEAYETIRSLRRTATVVEISGETGWVLADPDDDMIIETAIRGRADIIVSGDHHLQALGSVEGIRICSPRDFLDRLLQNE